MDNSRRHSMVIAVLLVIIACMYCGINNLDVNAESLTSNVSANCDTDVIQKGDEVRIDISTRKMKISTFIASLEYDDSQLKYVGYENVDGKQSVYLVDDSDKDIHFDVAVEHSDEKAVIGMYAIGTKDKTYAAADPLVTLIFKAKNEGEVEYRVTEATDGKDGYTSKEISEKSKPQTTSSAEGYDSESGVLEHAEKNNTILITIGIVLAIVLAACITVIMIRRRKDKNNDK